MREHFAIPESAWCVHAHVPDASDEGPHGLATLLARVAITEVSRELACDASAVRRWARGERTPSAEHRRLLAKLFGVPDAWPRARPFASPRRADAPLELPRDADAARRSPAPSDDEDAHASRALPSGRVREDE